ncbi:unnamed protein product [Eruca vesicaria subsp. sativa]|uniref:S-protein homolog n=1 Tax=Eruca vesicaria subsp. sativa TaxID=29727 RepID=A0ABC8KHP2_ERUVS|nr:unnamed protein product [Eruca vesicaria subsp. sativa]
MNRLSCFLLTIALIAGSSNALFEKNSVHFKNSLRPGNILKIHCISDSDDLGVHFLNPGQTYDFSFHDSFLKTYFDCTLDQGLNFSFRVAFPAYKSGGGLVRFGKTNFWDAREDGMYFTHGTEAPKLEYKWAPV